MQMLALKAPATRRAVLDLLSKGFAPPLIIEEDPLVATFSPQNSPHSSCACPHGQYSVATGSSSRVCCGYEVSHRSTNHKSGVNPS
jgi:hypothetical protein